jgi:hypothetical protein
MHSRLRTNSKSSRVIFVVAVVCLLLFFAYSFIGSSDNEVKDVRTFEITKKSIHQPDNDKNNGNHNGNHNDASTKLIETSNQYSLLFPQSIGRNVKHLQRAYNQLSEYYHTRQHECSQIDSNLQLYLKNFTTNKDKYKLPYPYFYYQCSGMCGGFGDRIRGTLTIFYLSLLSNGCFGINWNSPVPITNFFHLPTYDNVFSQCPTCKQDSFYVMDHWEPFRKKIDEGFRSERGGMNDD